MGVCVHNLSRCFIFFYSAKKRNRHKKGPVEVIDVDRAEELNLEDGDAQGSRSFSIQVNMLFRIMPPSHLVYKC